MNAKHNLKIKLIFLFSFIMLTSLIIYCGGSNSDEFFDPIVINTSTSDTSASTSGGNNTNSTQTSNQPTNNSTTETSTPISSSSPIPTTTNCITAIPLGGTFHLYSELLTFLQAENCNHPTLSKISIIGTSLSNRAIYAFEVSTNTATHQNKPVVNFNAAMHGNENCGTELTLYMMSYLLDNYSIDSRVTNIVNNTEIYFVPSVNPDGLVNRTRTNTNGVDINRNFSWAWVSGADHGSSAFSERESTAIKNFYYLINPNVAIDYHSGAVVVNYLWDYIAGATAKAADDALLANWSTQYAIHPTFLASAINDGFSPNGITNGGDWYVAPGSCQDWAYSALGTLDFTVEISDQQPGPASALNGLWLQNKEGMLKFIEYANTGIKGLVTDASTSAPLRAQIKILEINATAATQIYSYSNASLGDYHRPLLAGTYSMLVSSTGYNSQTISGLVVPGGGSVTRNVQLIHTKSLTPLPLAQPTPPDTSHIDVSKLRYDNYYTKQKDNK